VHFENVFVPRENIVGEEGKGWSIAISTLMYERVILTFARQLQSETLLRSLLSETSVERMKPKDRERLAREVVTFCAVRALSYDHLVDYQDGQAPGPEGSLDKLFWTDSFQSLVKFALELEGRSAALSEECSGAVHRYLYSRGRSIAAGTSEIQKNIIAERLLGLPRSR
jgi:alkylation response protein AidB-like acyl-CoA dehydrogenase